MRTSRTIAAGALARMDEALIPQPLQRLRRIGRETPNSSASVFSDGSFWFAG